MAAWSLPRGPASFPGAWPAHNQVLYSLISKCIPGSLFHQVRVFLQTLPPPLTFLSVNWLLILDMKVRVPRVPGHAAIPDSSAFPKKGKQSYHPNQQVYSCEHIPRQRTTHIHRNACPGVCTAAPLTAAKKESQPKCSSADDWVWKMRYINTAEYYSAMKRNDASIHTTAQMNLGHVVLGT